ncbi:MAG: DNA double-strand break repair nuclease NurA [Methanoregulaceae archaeon]|nr:DNA double-strand break repair nuclease NurA [Methanoregulaceae archaeon]
MNGYDESLASSASRIRALLPGNIGDLFARYSGDAPVHPAKAGKEATIAAVDGSNAAVLESGSLTLSAVRAGAIIFKGGEIDRKRTPLLLVSSGSEDAADDFSDMYRECFGRDPGKPLEGEDRAMTATLVRDTLEYWVAGQVLGSLEKGDLLLLDGALRVSHESHDPVLTGLIGQAGRKGVMVAAVAKRTSATFGSGYPLLPAASAYSAMKGVPSPWWMKIDASFLDQTRFPQWQHGEVHVVSLHRHLAVPLKVEFPARQRPEVSTQAVSLMAGCADDGRIPGYPFPLLEAHRAAVLSQAVIDQVRQDVVAALSREGISRATFSEMFSDYHDEFRRY